MAYSLDIRERVVKAYKEGESKDAVAKRYELSWWTVASYIKRNEQGNLAASSPPGAKPYLDAKGCEILKQQVQEHPDWTLEEHSDALYETTGIRLKKSAVSKYLVKMNLRYKKKPLSQ
jgi:transposase